MKKRAATLVAAFFVKNHKQIIIEVKILCIQFAMTD